MPPAKNTGFKIHKTSFGKTTTQWNKSRCLVVIALRVALGAVSQRLVTMENGQSAQVVAKA